METFKKKITSVGNLAADAACTTSKMKSFYVAIVTGFLVVLLTLGIVGYMIPSGNQSKKLNRSQLMLCICFLVLFSLVLAWNVFRYNMIDKLCDFKFPSGLGCPEYEKAWLKGFRNSKIITTAENTQMVSNALENSQNKILSAIGTAADTTASVGSSIAGFNMLFNDWDANFALYKCVTKYTMSKQAFILMRIAMNVIPVLLVSVTVYYAFHSRLTVILRKEAEINKKDDKKKSSQSSSSASASVFCIFVGVIIGLLIGKILCIIQTGKWRKKLGLTFIDWPRIIL